MMEEEVVDQPEVVEVVVSLKMGMMVMMVELEPMVVRVERKISDNKIFIKKNKCQ
jgi:hypothetical protein